MEGIYPLYSFERIQRKRRCYARNPIALIIVASMTAACARVAVSVGARRSVSIPWMMPSDMASANASLAHCEISAASLYRLSAFFVAVGTAALPVARTRAFANITVICSRVICSSGAKRASPIPLTSPALVPASTTAANLVAGESVLFDRRDCIREV